MTGANEKLEYVRVILKNGFRFEGYIVPPKIPTFFAIDDRFVGHKEWTPEVIERIESVGGTEGVRKFREWEKTWEDS